MNPNDGTPNGAWKARLATRRDLNSTNRRRDARQLAKLDIIRKSLNAVADQARWRGDPALAGHLAAIVAIADEALALEAEDVATHSTEAAILDFDAAKAAG